jgi:glucan-binding YG repeat protein
VKKKKIKRIIPLLLTVCALAAFFLLREQPAQDGWTVVDGQTFYYTEDQPLTHWQYLDGVRYYFGDDGALRTGWQELGGNRYYFDASGRMVTGWYADEDNGIDNEKVVAYNKLLLDLANEKGCYYLDVHSALVNENGVLPDDMSPDGIHLNAPHYQKWFHYLKTHTVQ